MEDFSATLDKTTRECIRQTTDILAPLLTEWVLRYPIIRPARTPMAALSTALVSTEGAAGVSPADYLPVAKMTLWIFGVDDVTDEQIVPLDEIRRRSAAWYEIAQRGCHGAVPKDELTEVLVEIRKDLSRFHMFEPLREEWASSLQSVLTGIVREYEFGEDYRARGVAALPSLDDYVYYGKCSIGVPLWSLSVLIVQGDPSAKENFRSTSEAIEYAGAAIRLYNDLRSFEREMEEGTVNSIQIRSNSMLEAYPGMSEKEALSQARQYVLELANEYAVKCYRLAENVQGGGRQFQESISRTVAFHAYFYGQHDYHTTSLVETHDMLGIP